MNSTLYVLQELNEQLMGSRQEKQEVGVALQYLPSSCTEIAGLGPTSPSGYYWINGLTGTPAHVYCDMTRQSCSCGSSRARGWMRVAHFDMTDPNQQCPSGFRLKTSPKRVCAKTRGEGCTSITFPAHSVQYSRVCGRMQAYQYASPDGIGAYYNSQERSLDGAYVDGVSISHGQSPRKHIWTFAAKVKIDTLTNVCDCINHPAPYVGNDYFCDSGIYSDDDWAAVLYPDPLWDGEECGPNRPCCQFNSPPWFCKELPQPTIDDIEVRVCSDQELVDEDTPIELIELYIQ